MSFNWKDTLSTVAPLIASAFGTPVAGLAVQAGLAALGIKPDVKVEKQQTQLEEALVSATPSDLLKLKKADYEFKERMEELGVEVQKLNQKDRVSARDLAKSSGVIPQVILSVVYTISYGFVMYMFMTGGVNVQDGQQVLFGSLIGILTAAQIQILNFWFGSSSGSKEKTKHLAK